MQPVDCGCVKPDKAASRGQRVRGRRGLSHAQAHWGRQPVRLRVVIRGKRFKKQQQKNNGPSLRPSEPVTGRGRSTGHQARRAVEAKMSKDQLGRPSQKRGSGGRRQKRNLEEEQGVQAVKKKKTMQQGAQSPEDITSWSTKVVRVTPRQRAKWCPLPKNTRECLESMMHWLITSLLYETTDNWSEIEKDLNFLKKRLLKHFETLRVPVEKLSSLKSVHEEKKSLVAEEKKKSLDMEEGLAELQNEIDKVMSAVEFTDQNIQCLQKKVQELKCELSAASKIFQSVGSDDLALPDLSEDQLKAPTLQDELLKIGNQQGLLNDLNTIQQSDEMKAVLAFLEQAYENVDF